MYPARMDALLDLAADHELPALLRGLAVFEIDPDDASEWRRRILARKALL